MRTQRLRTRIFAAGTGNFLEWYDFAIYGFFAASIGMHFFPAGDPWVSLLSAFGVFAVGYAARPIGGLVLGRLADLYGRKPIMLFSVSIVGTATFCIGLLPGYDQIGLAAPILLVVLRLIQGFCVAGEYTTSTVFLLEHAPRDRRGFVSSWSMFGEFAGVVAGSAVGAVTATLVGEQDMQDWGWRVPFLLSAVVTVFGIWLRSGIEESPEITRTDEEKALPPLAALRQGWRAIVCYVCLVLIGGVGFYIAFIYSASDIELHMHLTTEKALYINTIGQMLIMLLFPIAGYTADRIGRKPLAIAAAAGMLLFSWPLWWLMHHESFVIILIGQCLFGVILACGYPVYALMMAETLPVRLRCSVLSIGNGLAYGLFGGLTPLSATYLTERTGDDFAPVYLILIFATLSLVALTRLPETRPGRVATGL